MFDHQPSLPQIPQALLLSLLSRLRGISLLKLCTILIVLRNELDHLQPFFYIQLVIF